MKISLDSVKRKLEARSCPEHYQKPKVVIKDEQIQLTCCCDKFKTSLLKVVAACLPPPTVEAIGATQPEALLK